MKIKGVIAAICAAAALSVSAASAIAADVTVKLDGKQLHFDAEPFIENDRTLVPMRKIFEAVGANVEWDEMTRTAVARRTKDGNVITVAIQIDNPKAFIGTEGYVLDTPARIVNDRTFVPLRFVIEALGEKVEWDESTYTVKITTE